MRFTGTAIVAFLIVFSFPKLTTAQISVSDEAMASDLWAGGYSWLQTGNNLAAIEEWALALGSFSAALEIFVEVKTKYPEYSPEIIAYRLKKLKQTIADTEEKLEESEHDITMLYGDTIEMMEQAKRQRFFENDTGESLKSMLQAQSLMAELVGKNPEGFQLAMADQIARIEAHVAWANQELSREATTQSFASLAAASVMKEVSGTTEFIKEEDLPVVPDSDEAAISGALFPLN